MLINRVGNHHGLVHMLNLVEVIRYTSHELLPSLAVLSDHLLLKITLKWFLVMFNDALAIGIGILPAILDPLPVLRKLFVP
jgi:hypothetical protein